MEHLKVSVHNLRFSDHYLLTFEFLLINYEPRVTSYQSRCSSEDTVEHFKEILLLQLVYRKALRRAREDYYRRKQEGAEAPLQLCGQAATILLNPAFLQPSPVLILLASLMIKLYLSERISLSSSQLKTNIQPPLSVRDSRESSS